MASKNIVFRAIVFLCFVSIHTISASDKLCTINVKYGMHKKRPPTVVSTTGGSPNYLYPSADNPAYLVFKAGESVTLYCPDKTNQQSTKVTGKGVILLKEQPIDSPATVVCVGGTVFSADVNVDFKDISCEETPRTSYNAILRETGKKCLKGELYEIGYQFGDDKFLKTIDLCHDKKQANTVWAHAVVVPADEEKYRQTGLAKSFKSGSLFEDMQMSSKEPYNLVSAYNTVDEILGKNGHVDKYMSSKPSDRKYLARGHLVANADKMYKSEQDSTYFFANAVPMWQQINANPGNWFFVEEFVRHLSSQRQRELDIYVGGIGTMELESKPIHLYHKDGDSKIPVPKIIFKCAVDKSAGEGLCFLVVNNPYLTIQDIEDKTNNYLTCKKKNLCDKINKNQNDPKLGYLYCCSLADFYKSNYKELGLEDIKKYFKFSPFDLK